MSKSNIRAGVVGWPIEHSRSPQIHGYWIDKYNIDGQYEAIAVQPENAEAFFKDFRNSGFQGANVTVPYKELAYRCADETDELATRLGAVNTLFLKSGKLFGTNTDGYGFMAHLRSEAPDWVPGKRPAVILGAGGAARAIAGSLLDSGVPEILLVNRTIERAKTLAMEFGSKVCPVNWQDRGQILSDAGILVNTTVLGMTGKPALSIDLSAMPETAIVYDIVYTPLKTGLLRQARQRGLKTVDGLGMLLHQAVPGFEFWFGTRPEVTAELRAMVVAGLPAGPGAKIIGLTGSIAMGKTETARMFKELGVPVFDADAAVHDLYQKNGGAVAPVSAAFPDAQVNGAIDRARLSELVLGDPAAIKKLEKIVHPLVRQMRLGFIEKANRAGEKTVVVDVPLLFEAGYDESVDVIVVVSAPAEIQRERALARPGMTAEKFKQILKNQIPDEEKRRRADYVVDSSRGLDHAFSQVKQIVADLNQT